MQYTIKVPGYLLSATLTLAIENQLSLNKVIMKLFFTLLICHFSFFANAQNVGIGTTAPATSAMLEINATNKGLLIPRLNLLSSTDVVTIPTPVAGLLVINLNNNTGQMPDGAGYYVWTGSNWTKLLLKENGNTTGGWTTRGNTGTNPDSNFVGTTDINPLVFKVNNGFAGKIDIGSSISFGRGALQNSGSTKINTAFGDSALFNNDITNPSLGLATQNTSIGYRTLFTNTEGRRNTAVGHSALEKNISGAANTAIGFVALNSNDYGDGNTAIGSAALVNNTDGAFNTAIGTSALAFNTTGYSNVALGSDALLINNTGISNTAIGFQASYSNRKGNGNTAVGRQALYEDTSGNYNVAIGYAALQNTVSGSNLVAIGDSALYNQNNGSTQNTAIGSKVMYVLASGIQNTAAGYQAAYNTNNNFGTYLGYQAGRNTNGVSNTYIGWGAGTNASVGAIVTGGDNVCIGVRSGQGITGGGQNITIGNLINTASVALTNTVTIGHSISNSQNNSVVLGNGFITKWGFGTNATAANIVEFNSAVTTARLTTGGVWTNASDRFAKENINPLNKKEILNLIMLLPISRWNYKKESSNDTHIGPMAQDFYRLFNTGNDDKTISTIDPAGVALVGVQQLKSEIDDLKKEINDLKKIITRLQK